MCSHPIADCLTCAWTAMLGALPDRAQDWIELEGPFSPPGAPDFYRATLCGFVSRRYESKGDTPQEALQNLHELVTANRGEILRWREWAMGVLASRHTMGQA